MSNTVFNLETIERQQRAAAMHFTATTSVWSIVEYRQKIARALLGGQWTESERVTLQEAYNRCDYQICDALALPKPNKQQ